jgi:signal transduction histidine kinase
MAKWQGGDDGAPAGPLSIEQVVGLDFLDRPTRTVEGPISRQDSATSGFAQLGAVLEMLAEGLAVWGNDGRLIYCNGAYRAFYGSGGHRIVPGVRFEDMLNGMAEAAIFQPRGEALAAFLRNRLACHRRAEGMTEEALANGRWLGVNERRVLHGQVIALVGDITDYKQREQVLILANDEARAAIRAKDEFLANVSHEFRTPLNAILGFSDLMLGHHAGRLDNPKHREYLSDIQSAGTHLLHLINDALDAAKVGSGQFPLNEEVADVATVIEEAVRLVAERARFVEVHIERVIPASLPAIWVDPQRLRQILINLLTNAIKFTPSGGTVSVIVAASASGLDIVVRDTGIGMDAKQVTTALQPFGQAREAVHNLFGGTGLGLPLARGLTELHGGKLTVQSEPGRGTSITIALPASRLRPR